MGVDAEIIYVKFGMPANVECRIHGVCNVNEGELSWLEKTKNLQMN